MMDDTYVYNECKPAISSSHRRRGRVHRPAGQEQSVSVEVYCAERAILYCEAAEKGRANRIAGDTQPRVSVSRLTSLVTTATMRLFIHRMGEEPG
jgi:hypothetical protein